MTDPTPKPRLTPAQIDQVVDNTMANGQLKEAPPLTPDKIEVLLARTILNPEIKEMATYKRADGTSDYGPLANVVRQVTASGGPEAQAITYMFAAYGIAAYAAKVGGAK